MMSKAWVVAGSMAIALALAAGAEAQVWLSVDCNAGETIGEALLKTAGEQQVMLSVAGTCRESVEIRRDDVALLGQTGAAIVADATQQYALYVNRGRRISASGLTLQGGYSAALLVVYGEMTGSRLTISGGNGGVQLQNADLALSESTIRGNAHEGVVAYGGKVSLSLCRIYKNRSYGVWLQHAEGSFFDVEIMDNMTGVAGDAISAVLTAGHYVRIHDNQLGVRLRLNSVAWHNGALPTVSNNATDFDVDPSSIW